MGTRWKLPGRVQSAWSASRVMILARLKQTCYGRSSKVPNSATAPTFPISRLDLAHHVIRVVRRTSGFCSASTRRMHVMVAGNQRYLRGDPELACK